MHYSQRFRQQLQAYQSENDRLLFHLGKLSAENRVLFSANCRLKADAETFASAQIELQDELIRFRDRNQDRENECTTLREERDQLLGIVESQKNEIRKLARELNKRSWKEEFYGSATPSSKQFLRPNSPAENRAKRGGAKVGHPGHGRRGFDPANPEVEVIDLTTQIEKCACDCDMEIIGRTSRSVQEYIPGKFVKRLYEQGVFECPSCKSRKTSFVKGILPNHLYGNCLCAHLLAEHYFHGQTIGSLEKRWGVNHGTFLQMAHRSAQMLQSVFDKILDDLRLRSRYIHADETSWSMDGVKSYAWYFGNQWNKVFLFPHTRSSEVPRTLLEGVDPQTVLVTDRYRGYVDALPLEHQYCYVHLLRDVKDMEPQFPDDPEIATFSSDLKHALKKAIKLCSQEVTANEYIRQAGQIKEEILRIIQADARHEGIQSIQNIFREHPEKIFQWTRAPGIPCENNYAERALRPTVIMRKNSFGSHSERGLKTKEILMTVMHTAAARGYEVALYLKDCFDQVAAGLPVDPLPFPA